jgi:putative transcriptional regulator
VKNGSITKFKLDPKKALKTDWRSFDSMGDEERHRAAPSDPDAEPVTAADLQRARRPPNVRALRRN